MRNRDGNQGGPQGGMRGGPNDRKMAGRGQTSEDGWTSVQPKVSQRSTYDRIDTSKITNLAQNSARRVSLVIDSYVKLNEVQVDCIKV